MRRLRAALLDLAAGGLILALAFACTRLLLRSHSGAYLLFPLLSLAAAGLGYWRASARELPGGLTVILLDLPLATALGVFLSARDRGLFAMLAVTVTFAALGVALRRPPALATALVAGNVVLALLVPRFVDSLVQSREVHEAAPPFVLRLVDGSTVPSSQLAGRVVVLDFWATWCVPCRRELPEIDRLTKELATRPDVAIFAIDSSITDVPGEVGDTPAAARALFTAMGLTMPLGYSGDGAIEKAFALHGFPALVVLDRAGNVRLRRVGFVGAEDLAGNLGRLIATLRAEPVPPPRAAD
jgi:thiol-disulfide isomerase/thioredoxin